MDVRRWTRCAGAVTLPVLVLLAAVATLAGPARAGDAQRAPQALGRANSGCLAGAEALEARGTGYESIRRARNLYYGHPTLVAFVRSFGLDAMSVGLPTVLIGDLAGPKGGPLPSGHRSHQTGLDVDIWFTRPSKGARVSDAGFASMVDATGLTLGAAWGQDQLKMLKLAAARPEVDRIFVNPAIKAGLCERTHYAKRRWFRKLRPWWGHDRHFHVRLRCPEGSPECVPQDPLPKGDGCRDLQWWFSKEAQQQRGLPSNPPPPPPRACKAIQSE